MYLKEILLERFATTTHGILIVHTLYQGTRQGHIFVNLVNIVIYIICAIQNRKLHTIICILIISINARFQFLHNVVPLNLERLIIYNYY